MQTRLLTTLACASLLAATACGTTTETTSRSSAYLKARDVARARPAADISYRDIAHGNQQLGYELARAIPTQDGNLVFSPASLSIAFAMLREGAVGGTAAEIDRVLHLPANRSAAYNGLLHELAQVGSGTDLEVNDGLFLDPSLTVKQSYLLALKKWYGAGVEQTAFPNPALDVINRWVDVNTHGRIPKLLDQLDPAAVFALVNTVYLDAKWQHPFSASDTSKASFTTSAGRRVTASMMHSTSKLDYAAGSGWQAVRLPYRGNDLSMLVLLPRGGKVAPSSLLKPAALAAVTGRFAARDVELSLPKWDLQTSANLVPVLESLGMKLTFGSGGFSALTSDPSFAVSQVVQQANITVGEKGTKAAAATAIIGETIALPPRLDAVPFVADHPFAFAIVHNVTGVPLFEGVVADPS